MKKACRLLAIILVLTLALCACGKDTPETTVPTTDPVPETTEPQIHTPVVTEPRDTKPAETEPVETGPDYDAYAALLSEYGSKGYWLANAMTCVFGQPEDIDLASFFYGTMTSSWESISEESKQYLVGQGYSTSKDLQVRPLDAMEQIMQDVFGISLSDVESGIPSKWRYLAEEKAYVSNHNDTNVVTDYTITWIEEYAGNRIDIFYTINGSYYNTATREYLTNPDMVLALRKTDGGYQILANLVAPDK